ALLSLVFLSASCLLKGGIPLLSLGTTGYSLQIAIVLSGCLGLMFAEAVQLYRVWAQLRRLLVFLDQIPLRRTLAGLRGFSWGNVWKMSGNVLDVRYKLLSRQLESRNHLATSLEQKIKATERELPGRIIGCIDVLTRCDKLLNSAIQWEGD